MLLPVLCVSIGCASIDLTDADLTAPPENEALAYGRINVVIGNKAAQWQHRTMEQLTSVKAAFTRVDGRFWLNLVNESTKAHLEPEVYNDGSFYWHMPPGKYFLIGYRWLQNGAFIQTDINGSIRARIEIPSRSSACYLGSLRIVFQNYESGPSEISVIDEFENGSQVLAQRFPRLKIDSQRCFFKIGAPQ